MSRCRTSPGQPVLIVLGSDSDLPMAKKCSSVLDEFDVPYSITISSAHRSPDRTSTLAKEASGKGFKVIIAFAGAAAALPGVMAANTSLPVIGVPVCGRELAGLDSLLSMVQMPGGVPVGVVGLDNGVNAALLALRILALDKEFEWLGERIREHQRSQAEAVDEKAAAIQGGGSS